MHIILIWRCDWRGISLYPYIHILTHNMVCRPVAAASTSISSSSWNFCHFCVSVFKQQRARQSQQHELCWQITHVQAICLSHIWPLNLTSVLWSNERSEMYLRQPLGAKWKSVSYSIIACKKYTKLSHHAAKHSDKHPSVFGISTLLSTSDWSFRQPIYNKNKSYSEELAKSVRPWANTKSKDNCITYISRSWQRGLEQSYSRLALALVPGSLTSSLPNDNIL